LTLAKTDTVVSSKSGFGQLIISPNSLLSVNPVINSDGQILSLDVMPLNNSVISQHQTSISISYSDMLDIQPINAPSQPVEIQLDNGSVLATESISINNTQNMALGMQTFPLFQTYSNCNLTSYLCVENGNQASSPPNTDFVYFNHWVWLAWGLTVPAHHTMNITVYATFDGATGQ